MPYFSVREGRAICMEHLKRTPEQTLARLCDWMGIDDSPTLYRQTVQGEKWWGDPSALDFQQGRDRDPFDTASIDHNLGRVLSDDDLSILGTLLLPFRQHAGYQSTDDDRLTMDLEALRPLLDKPLDFEKKIFKEMNYRGGDPTRHVSYRSFHQLLINRWNILSATGAYPHMIEML